MQILIAVLAGVGIFTLLHMLGIGTVYKVRPCRLKPDQPFIISSPYTVVRLLTVFASSVSLTANHDAFFSNVWHLCRQLALA